MIILALKTTEEYFDPAQTQLLETNSEIPIKYVVRENPMGEDLEVFNSYTDAECFIEKYNKEHRTMFLSGYDNVYNDSPYDEGYLDALCMLDQFNVWSEQESKALKKAKQFIVKKLSD